ncbi:MAG: ornithine--oxo-acid transaminase [Bacteroidota bacterium]|jgi:ornithine--oxo-acid transaminase
MSTERGEVAPYFRGMNTNATLSSADLMALEDAHGAHNYHPLPVVLDRGEGVHVWDVEGNQYFDFLSAYSAVNQGHCHPRIVKVMQDQTAKLTLTSRAFYNSILGPYEKYVTEYFGYDKVLPMNTGAEAVETAIKIARKWAYDVKGVPSGAAKIITCSENFHGRTTTIVSFSTDPDSTGGFGPYTPGFEVIPYNDLDALAAALKDPNVAGFLVEPIQGEAGVNVPADDYIREAYALCKAANVLFMADEVQTGIARTGALLATCGNCTCEAKCERQSTYVKADLLILGKAISGGAYPVSAVLADDEVMGVIHPGQHGSTFGGNPVAGVVATEALAVVADEKLAQNARALGVRFREAMQELVDESPLLKAVRGRGLLNAVLINDTPDSSTAWDLCVALKDNGLLAKPTHGNIIRFAPPLVMTAEQLEDCIGIIAKTVREFTKA